MRDFLPTKEVMTMADVVRLAGVQLFEELKATVRLSVLPSKTTASMSLLHGGCHSRSPDVSNIDE